MWSCIPELLQEELPRALVPKDDPKEKDVRNILSGGREEARQG